MQALGFTSSKSNKNYFLTSAGAYLQWMKLTKEAIICCIMHKHATTMPFLSTQHLEKFSHLGKNQ